MTQPTVRFLVSHPAHFIALGFGSGLAPKAPGTFGTLAAFPLFWLLTALNGDIGTQVVIVAAASLLGIWVCEITGQNLGVQDSGHVVWDEIVAFVLVLIFTPFSVVWMTYAFGLFRLFDIWKPFPIGWLDTRVKGGLGVMLDDLLAAGYALGVLFITQLFTS
jgi:phosphatidylglycerophosphatase A